MKDKKNLNDLFSKKRYILIDKLTGLPLCLCKNPSINKLTSTELCPMDNKNKDIVIFDEPIPLNVFVKNKYNNTYRTSNPFNPKNPSYSNYEKAKDKIVWRRLSKDVDIESINFKTKRIGIKSYFAKEIFTITIKK